jgi:hypothetical protein
MTDGRRLDRRRLALVAARFQSPHDGERLAALEAFGRLLNAGGGSWDDLLAPLKAAGEGAAKDKGRDRTPQQLAADLAREAGDALTRWEISFLHGCSTFRTLSPKQLDMLDEIQRKVERAAP